MNYINTTEREELIAALKPFALVGNLNSIRRHPNMVLWSVTSSTEEERIQIKTRDVINASGILKKIGAL